MKNLLSALIPGDTSPEASEPSGRRSLLDTLLDLCEAFNPGRPDPIIVPTDYPEADIRRARSARPHRPRRRSKPSWGGDPAGALVLAALIGVLGAGACSKSGRPTAPVAGGGGGGGFNLGPFAVGQSERLAFPSAGTFGYHCIPHRSMGMTGEVQVDANGADSLVVQVAAAGFSFTPSTAHIRPGGFVRWVNVSSSTQHTVTAD